MHTLLYSVQCMYTLLVQSSTCIHYCVLSSTCIHYCVLSSTCLHYCVPSSTYSQLPCVRFNKTYYCFQCSKHTHYCVLFSTCKVYTTEWQIPKFKTRFCYENQFYIPGFLIRVRHFCGYQYLCYEILFHLVSSYYPFF